MLLAHRNKMYIFGLRLGCNGRRVPYQNWKIVFVLIAIVLLCLQRIFVEVFVLSFFPYFLPGFLFIYFRTVCSAISCSLIQAQTSSLALLPVSVSFSYSEYSYRFNFSTSFSISIYTIYSRAIYMLSTRFRSILWKCVTAVDLPWLGYASDEIWQIISFLWPPWQL